MNGGMAMSSYKDYKKRALQNPEVKADISRIENGTRNPSLSIVKKLAQGLGMQLKLEFVLMPTKNKM